MGAKGGSVVPGGGGGRADRVGARAGGTATRGAGDADAASWGETETVWEEGREEEVSGGVAGEAEIGALMDEAAEEEEEETKGGTLCGEKTGEKTGEEGGDMEVTARPEAGEDSEAGTRQTQSKQQSQERWSESETADRKTHKQEGKQDMPFFCSAINL